MSICRKEGKDTIIFASKEDHATPSTIDLPELEPRPGLILPNGDINWNCPCLGGMATGPCGLEFREAFSCFHFSESDPKGSDCAEGFKKMQLCIAEFPSLYASKDIDLEDDEENDPDAAHSENMKQITEERTKDDVLKSESDDALSTKREVERVKTS